MATGDFKSITIADSTNIDEISSIGINGNGWVAIVVLEGLTSLVGTLDAAKLTIEVSDPGYTTSGGATTVTRTINGVAHLRRQYPNLNSKMISTDAVDLTIYVTLDDWIYDGTTIVSASIAAGFYPSSNASDAVTVTNSSTRDYTKPLFAWINPQMEYATSGSHLVEAVAFHRHARNQQQVAAIGYTVTDGSTTTSEQIIGTSTLSTRQTQGYIAECFAATIDFSGMTQGVICNVNAKVYPWIGDSDAVLDLSVDGTAWGTALPQTLLRVFCDRTGAYSGAFAYVRTGASAGTVSTTAATAAADPYPTIESAATALRAWNNSNKSHDDMGGTTMRLMDDGAGGDVTYSLSASLANSTATGIYTIEKDPDTEATISYTGNGVLLFPTMARWRNMRIASNAGSTYTLVNRSVASGVLILDGCEIDNTENKNIVTFVSFVYMINCTMSGGNQIRLMDSPPSPYGFATACGVVAADNTTRFVTASELDPTALIGCHLPGFAPRTNYTSPELNAGRIIYNNRINGFQIKSSGAYTLPKGIAFVQNLGESTSEFFMLLPDGGLMTASNVIEVQNTFVGQRNNRAYNDAAGTKVAPSGVQKIIHSAFNVWDNRNHKGDEFNGGGIGSVGGYSYGYAVGQVGNVSLFGQVSRLANTGAPNNDATDVYTGYAWLPSSEYSLFRTALGFSQADIMGMFANYTVDPQGSPALGGDYVPNSDATHLQNRVPSGLAVLRYDLAGNPRANDGTGAAGAYAFDGEAPAGGGSSSSGLAQSVARSAAKSVAGTICS